jgi:hypothetical protein
MKQGERAGITAFRDAVCAENGGSAHHGGTRGFGEVLVSNPSWQPWQPGQGDSQWAQDVTQSGQDVPQSGPDVPRSGRDVPGPGQGVQPSGRDASRAGHGASHSWQKSVQAGDAPQSGPDVPPAGYDMTQPGWKATQAGPGLSRTGQGASQWPQAWQVASASAQGSWQGHGGSAMLAAHADRERAVDVLRAGYAEGRLEKGEFDQRVARAYAARTVGELALLVADLPQGPVPVTQPVPPVPRTFLPAPVPPTNGKAIGSMICGGLTFFTAGLTGIPAVILGHTARAEMQRTGERGEGLAMTGLVLGWLSVAGWLLVFTILVAAGLAST